MADFPSHEAPVHQASALPLTAPAKLIGRDTTLARVYTHLKENRAVLLYGMTGIGKTAVAATLASAYTELPGGSLWLHVHSPTLAELVVRIGRAYDLPNVTTSDTPIGYLGAIASQLTRSKPLIVLDGKISAEVANEFLVKCASGLPMLIVSDDDLDGGWTKFPLNALEPTQAAALFRAAADLPDAPQEEIAGLVTALNYTPFALVVAGGHIKSSKQSPADFRAALPPAGGSVNPTLLALTVAFKGLNNALQGLMLVLGATYRGFGSAELISMIASAPKETIQQALDVLVSRSLIEKSTRYGEAYYRLHPLTHAFAQTWLKGSGRLPTLQAKVRESVLSYARKYSTPSTDAHNHLALEMDIFLEAARAAADAGDRDLANQLVAALTQAGDFVSGRGYIYELLELRRLAASSTTAFPAYASVPLAAPAAAVADAAKTKAAELDDEELEDEDILDEDEDFDEEDSDELEPLPPIIPAVGESVLPPIDTDEDEDDSEEISPFRPPSPAPAAVVSSVPPLSPVSHVEPLETGDEDEDELEPLPPGTYDEDEDVDSAFVPPVPADEVARLRNELIQARQSGDRRRQADVILQIANLLRERGMDDQAISTYTEALNLQEALNDNAGMLVSLSALAELTTKTDNLEAAVLYASRGASAAEKQHDDAAQMRLLTLLADARQELGDSADAVRAYEQALDLARTGVTATPDTDEAQLLFKLGFAHLDSSQPQNAINVWEEALTLFRKQNKRDFEGRVLGGLGSAYGELDRWTEAINFHMSALYIAREVKDKEEELLQLSNLGYANVQAHQLGQAVLRYRQALHVAYETNDRESIVGTCADLARLLVESPRHLAISEMLVEAGLAVEPASRELRRLKERIEDEREALGDDLPEQAPVAGDARAYAENAYSMLDQ